MTLREALAELEETMKRFPSASHYKVPDVVLYNLAIDVAEHGYAVSELSLGSVPRASLTNARAALESCIDMAFLVSDQAEYARRGARARVFELFELERIQRRGDLIATVLPGSSEALEHAVREDARDWESDAPGQGKLITAAWEYFWRNRAAIGEHWSGHSRLELYRQLAADDPSVGEFVRMLDVVYGLLSIAAHPRPRGGQRTMTFVEPDSLVFSSALDNRSAANDVATLAVQIAGGSLQRRREWCVPTA